MKRSFLLLIPVLLSILIFFLLNLVLGTISIPIHAIWNILWGIGEEPVVWENIIWKSRFPQTLTALVAGAGLSISGLQMQTVFRNPLAGPSELGISSGASLGVAFIILLSGTIGSTALSKLGFFRGSSNLGRCDHRCDAGDGYYYRYFPEGAGKCNSTDHWSDDRIYCHNNYRSSEIL